MKKTLLTFLSIIALLSLFSCKEEKDSSLLFDEEYVSNSDNIILEYYSPDPGCGIPKLYYVTANKFAGELVLKCKNADVIAIKNYPDGVLHEYVSTDGGWKAEVVNSNTIKLTFDEIDQNPGDDSGELQEWFKVVSLDQKDELSETISILRLAAHSDPLR